MLTKRRTITLPLAIILAITGWLFLRDTPHPSENTVDSKSPASSREETAVVSNQDAQSAVDSVESLVTRVFGELELLKQVHGEGEGQKVISRLLASFEGISEEVSTKAILRVLSSGEDALAFGRFAPGQDGFLTAYPSFRTALLDLLEKLDPAEAVKMGKSILDSSENADEWALSLRALSRYAATTQDKVFLQAKVQELLRKEAWLADPTFSYLHAFDAAVVDGQSETIERLGDLLKSAPNKAVAHAATLSVDRLFQNYTQSSTSYLVSHPEFLAETSGFRASLMARIDPGDPLELASVEDYLEGGSFSAEEKRTFFQLFPNFNTTFSFNLISKTTLPSRAAMREKSRTAHTQLTLWKEENRYPGFEDDINTAINRLTKAWKFEL